MVHKLIKKKLILYLDGDLPEHETAEVKDHLSQCSSCEKELRLLSSVWINKNSPEKIANPEYLWTKIDARLREFNNENQTRSFIKLAPAFRLMVVVILLLGAVLLGNYIGRVSNDDIADRIDEYLWTSYSLDYLEPVPKESIGKIFSVELISREGGMQK